MATTEQISGYEPHATGYIDTVLTYNNISKTICVEIRSFKHISSSFGHGVRGLGRFKIVLLPHLAYKIIKLDPADLRNKGVDESLQIFVYFNINPERNLKTCNLLVALYFRNKLNKSKIIIGEAFIYLYETIKNFDGQDNPYIVRLQPLPLNVYRIQRNILIWGLSPYENQYKLLLGTVYRSDTGRLEIKILKVDYGRQKSLIKKSKLDVVAFDYEGNSLCQCSFNDLPTSDISLKYDKNNILNELVMDASYLFSMKNRIHFLTLGFIIKLKSFKCKPSANFSSILRSQVQYRTYGIFSIGFHKTSDDKNSDDANQLEMSFETPDQFIKRWHKFYAP